MVIGNGNEIVCQPKRRGLGWRYRRSQRNKIRQKSRDLVKAGVILKTPCLICGSRENLTIHHLEPIRPDRFVFLCEPCHILAHTPLYRVVKVRVSRGQFSVRPDAIAPRRKEVTLA